MKNWRNLIVTPSTSIIETMKMIDQNASQIALVADFDNTLLGTVTDGDIRRGILQGVELNKSISLIMNKEPFKVTEGTLKRSMKKICQEKKLRHLPVVNQNNQIVDLYFFDQLSQSLELDYWIVLMAGGLGTRLRPLTEEIPKPMLTVGTKPILQTILESFIDYGFYEFFFSVNYKKEYIEEHFGNGSDWDVNIKYLIEEQRLGTAGALSLFKTRPKKPIIVMNGDILTNVNFQHLIEFHEGNNSVATMCVREYQYQIPYGVVKMDGTSLCSIEEKPTERYFVNAGIYVLNPEVIDFIPNDQYYDMPSLFEQLMKYNLKTSAFPIREYWLDIGKMEELERANNEYSGVFG